jgi:hypothetical protein
MRARVAHAVPFPFMVSVLSVPTWVPPGSHLSSRSSVHIWALLALEVVCARGVVVIRQTKEMMYSEHSTTCYEPSPSRHQWYSFLSRHGSRCVGFVPRLFALMLMSATLTQRTLHPLAPLCLLQNRNLRSKHTMPAYVDE